MGKAKRDKILRAISETRCNSMAELVDIFEHTNSYDLTINLADLSVMFVMPWKEILDLLYPMGWIPVTLNLEDAKQKLAKYMSLVHETNNSICK